MRCPQYKIGLSVAELVPLTWHGIPYPVSHTYAPYSVERTCGDGQRKGFGFAVVSWTWLYMNQTQLQQIYSLFDNDAAASVTVYITTYKDVGWDTEYANFRAIMSRPMDGRGKTLIPKSSFNFSNIVLTFSRLQEV